MEAPDKASLPRYTAHYQNAKPNDLWITLRQKLPHAAHVLKFPSGKNKLGATSVRSAVFIIALCFGCGDASSREFLLSVTNNSGQSISGISASIGNEALIQNSAFGSEGIGPGSATPVEFTLPDDLCVFDLTFRSPGGGDIVRPAVDLCQTEAIIIE